MGIIIEEITLKILFSEISKNLRDCSYSMKFKDRIS